MVECREVQAGTRDFNFKCKSANRSHEGIREGGMKVPAIVLIRMRISMGTVFRYRRAGLSRPLRDAASLVIVKMQ